MMIMVEYLMQIEFASYMKQRLGQRCFDEGLVNWRDFISVNGNSTDGMDKQ